jgi:glycosyltransferase involved in cell wall biosynthesis
LGGRVYVFDEYFNGKNYFKFKRQWADFFKSHPEYIIIHCHVRSVASIVLKIAKRNGLKTICHSHSTSNGKGVKVVAKRFFQRRIKDYSDYCFACSEESAKWLYGEEIAKSDKCVIVKNAIDASKYSFNKDTRMRVRKNLGVDDKIVLGQVGRIEAVKNYGFSLDLLKRLLDQNNRYHLLIVGTGSLKGDILKKAEALNIKKCITILENRNDVNEIMQAMDVFLLPSEHEGLPYVVIEAQTAGLKCVVSDVITDEVDVSGNVHFLSLDCGVEVWAENLINCLKNPVSDRRKMADFMAATDFNIENEAKRLEKILKGS